MTAVVYNAHMFLFFSLFWGDLWKFIRQSLVRPHGINRQKVKQRENPFETLQKKIKTHQGRFIYDKLLFCCDHNLGHTLAFYVQCYQKPA